MATDIVHQHSSRLDYYKGYSILPRRISLLALTLRTETLLSSTLLNPNASVTSRRSTMLRWNTGSICRRSLTDGATTPTEVSHFCRSCRIDVHALCHISCPGAVQDQNSGESGSPLFDSPSKYSRHFSSRTYNPQSWKRRKASSRMRLYLLLCVYLTLSSDSQKRPRSPLLCYR